MVNKQATIREATEQDWQAIWKILCPVFRAGETYCISRTISESDAKDYWFGHPTKTFVAEFGTEVVGTYYIRPNQPGPGSHICNCGYIVDEKAMGKGVAKAMGNHSLSVANQLGFLGMQFNFVVSTNRIAIDLWKKLGFEIVGQVPGSFDHPKLGLVDSFIMFRKIT